MLVSRIPRPADHREDVLVELEPDVVHRVDHRVAEEIVPPLIHQREATLEASHVLGIPRYDARKLSEGVRQTVNDALNALLNPFVAFALLPIGHELDELAIDGFEPVVPLDDRPPVS